MSVKLLLSLVSSVLTVLFCLLFARKKFTKIIVNNFGRPQTCRQTRWQSSIDHTLGEVKVTSLVVPVTDVDFCPVRLGLNNIEWSQDYSAITLRQTLLSKT